MNDKNETPKIIRLVETDSTNNYLREQSAKARLPEGSLVIADFQTAGKGQVGNSWESEAGKNLMFSILLYPDFLPANRQFLISQIASLSVKETLEKYTDSVTVKWPNDIYWKDRKICGMLIENDLSGQYLYCSVVGIGLNINQEIFRSDAPNPVSLTQITGKTYDREDVWSASCVSSLTTISYYYRRRRKKSELPIWRPYIMVTVIISILMKTALSKPVSMPSSRPAI